MRFFSIGDDDMVQIEFYDDGRVIKGILLAKYQRRHDEVYSWGKKVFGKAKTKYARRRLKNPLYVIFIPWKHKLKELIEVDEKYIINSQPFRVDETWITKDKFISKTGYDIYSFSVKVKIKNFVGYKFIYDNNSFIAKMSSHEFEDCLAILYKNMPEILDIDLENKEVR